jgi:oligopeptide/dipeptide ABC transporter ATP-binding protein
MIDGTPSRPLLEVQSLTKRFPLTRGVIFAHSRGAVHAVEDVTFTVARGRTLGIVGESGSGKSTTARMIVRLIDPTSGTIVVDGTDITRLVGADLRTLRQQVQMVFQDAYGSLNPRQTAGQIIGAPLRVHRVPGDRRARVAGLLERVGLNPEHAARYPHEFSGGQRQRIGIARALALSPTLMILDEPVSALDVSVQAHVLNLLTDLQDEHGITYIVISHDLGVIRHLADRVAVMYLGRIVELADAAAITAPRHPYTAALVSAAPTQPGAGAARRRIVLTGDAPSPIILPTGCAFHARCPKARLVSGDPHRVPERCRSERPPLDPDADGRQVACWYPLESGDDLIGAAQAMAIPPAGAQA